MDLSIADNKDTVGSACLLLVGLTLHIHSKHIGPSSLQC